MPVLDVTDLSKRYGEREAVRSISFDLPRSQIFGLLGPNGAGKTTTIGMVAGIVSPSSGAVHVAGKLGLVPQRIALYPTFTAEENLDFFGRIHGLDRSVRKARVEALIEMAGLTSRAGDPVGEFSSGMKRRLNLVCGVVHEPDLVLLDEPTVGVDPQSRERIYESLVELAKQGLALLLTTHYLDEAERLCDRIAIMDEGSIIANGSVDELLGHASLERTLELELVRKPREDLGAKLDALGARLVAERSYSIAGAEAMRMLPELLALVAAEGNDVHELRVHRPNLGDVFLHLTGKALRD